MFWFHNGSCFRSTVGISLLVLALIVYIVWRFNETANPCPRGARITACSRFAWTVAPALILVVIAVPSFRLLADQLIIPRSGPDAEGDGVAVALELRLSEIRGRLRLQFALCRGQGPQARPAVACITADNPMVVPVGKVIEVDVTSQDVIHSFSVPSFGVKIDAIPGRLNKSWFKAERVGVFYGQCSNICGIDHAFMPIKVRVVSQADYEAWLVEAKKQFAVLGRRRRRGGAVRPSLVGVPRRWPSRRPCTTGVVRHGVRQPISLSSRRRGSSRARAFRPAGGGICFPPTTRTSGRSISSSPSLPA